MYPMDGTLFYFKGNHLRLSGAISGRSRPGQAWLFKIVLYSLKSQELCTLMTYLMITPKDTDILRPPMMSPLLLESSLSPVAIFIPLV